MKTFNTAAVCIPEKHYMVDLTGRVAEIRRLVDAGKYFTINRARQYGKTTTLEALQRGIENDYLVLNLSFEGITHENFATATSKPAFPPTILSVTKLPGKMFTEAAPPSLN